MVIYLVAILDVSKQTITKFAINHSWFLYWYNSNFYNLNVSMFSNIRYIRHRNLSYNMGEFYFVIEKHINTQLKKKISVWTYYCWVVGISNISIQAYFPFELYISLLSFNRVFFSLTDALWCYKTFITTHFKNPAQFIITFNIIIVLSFEYMYK